MKYKIAICDDEQNQIEYITSIVASWSAHEGHSCEIRTFASAEAFLFEYEEDKAYDILLLDVEMKNMNGIELAKRIRKDNNRAEIIFITSHFEFVSEGYEVDALHYLIEPVSTGDRQYLRFGVGRRRIFSSGGNRPERRYPYAVYPCGRFPYDQRRLCGKFRGQSPAG